MKKFYLGIDLGTSSAKAVARSKDGATFKAKRSYDEESPSGWIRATQALIADLKKDLPGEIASFSFSSQVGTYIVDGKHVISWRSSVGREELSEIREKLTDTECISAIGMRHPDLVSYPLPRLLYIQRNYGPDAKVLMPKEILIHALTGETVSDVFSMRGIAHPEKMQYADSLTEKLGISLRLPALRRPTDRAGTVTAQAAQIFGLTVGTPVYLGCNDFFAGLLGMGIYTAGDAFDLSGTSEHIGYISEARNPDGFVSGHYFNGFCTYGGTKASGASCDFAIRNFGIDGIAPGEILSRKPPVFLPYLSGERAPIFDENARGAFFGIDEKTDKQSLAYAVLEGVVFSLYDIAESMHMPSPKRLICGGGSARDSLMNLLRATLLGCETVSVRDNDTSALGACMLAMIGEGVYADIPSAIRECVQYIPGATPDSRYREILKKRFEIYKDVYRNLKPTFKKYNTI